MDEHEELQEPEDAVEDLEVSEDEAADIEGGVGSGKAKLFARDNIGFDQSSP